MKHAAATPTGLELERSTSADSIPPERVYESLKAYVEERRMTGGFLHAVLTNNLYEAVARADETNRAALVSIVKFIYNHMPQICYGTEEKVRAWLNGEERDE